MPRHSKLILVLILVFAGWFIGVSSYQGYSLLNEADFMATNPQFENPDLFGPLAGSKKVFCFPIMARLTLSLNPRNHLSFIFFPKPASSKNSQFILRC
jgi:hypothetical protein